MLEKENLALESLDDLTVTMFRGAWKVEEPLHFYVSWTDPHTTIKFENLYRVPAGFRTDFASVPRLPLLYAVFGNVAHRAATVHDFLYSPQGSSHFTRADADEIFRQAAERDGVGKIRARLLWAAVRLFGRPHWTPKSFRKGTQ